MGGKGVGAGRGARRLGKNFFSITCPAIAALPDGLQEGDVPEGHPPGLHVHPRAVPAGQRGAGALAAAG